jgi:hydrogenase maturation protein HypF
MRVGRRIAIRGVVQGVGFRPWVYRLAREEGLGGAILNDPRGITIEAFGPDDAIASFIRRLQAAPPPAASILGLETETIPFEDTGPFAIAASDAAGERRVSIPPDMATCPACEAELRDPGNRRHRYAFTNCTNCGPRFTIARGVPYDRGLTTMAAFEMCASCRGEYEAVEDRRFHAEPNACPVCGPRLAVSTPDGVPITVDDPLAFVAAQRTAPLRRSRASEAFTSPATPPTGRPSGNCGSASAATRSPSPS